MKKNRLILRSFIGLIVILTLLVYFLPQTSFGRGIILSQLGSTLAEQGYDLNYQDSSGNLWRRLELTQTSLTTQGATLNFDTVGFNYDLLKFLTGEKPLAINLKGVDGDVFLKQLLDRQQANSNLVARYIEDISIEEISLNLQDLPYDLPEFNLSNLDLLAFEANNTHLRGELSTEKGLAELDLKIENTEPFKAKITIEKADAVLAQHWTQRVKAGQVSGQIDIDAGEVTGGLELTDSQLDMADIDITNIDGQFQLANNQLTGQATGTAFDSLANGTVEVDLEKQQWQSQLTSTTNLQEASAWIFRKSPMVHDYLQLSGQAPIELNLSGWQDIELTGKAVAEEGLTMMDEPLKNVETDIYFNKGRTDVTVKADYMNGQMDYVRIAANQETLVTLQGVVFANSENQTATLDADVVFATGEMGLKRLDGPLAVDYSILANGQEENFKADIQANIKEDNWNFDLALADNYGNDALATVAMSSTDTIVSMQSESLELDYLDSFFPNLGISKLTSGNTKLDASTTGLTFTQRLALGNEENLRSLLGQTQQLKVVGDEVSLTSDEQTFSTANLNATIDLQNSKSSVTTTALQLPFDFVSTKLVDAELQTEGDVFTLDVKADSSFVEMLDAKELAIKGQLKEGNELIIQDLDMATLSANGQLDLAQPLTLSSLGSLAEAFVSNRGSLNYSLAETPIVVDSLSENALQISGTGTLEVADELKSQATLDVVGIDVFGLPETIQADLNWQQDGVLTIVDNDSGLSLNRKVVPLANSLGVLDGDDLTNTIAVSEVVLENTPLELLGQSVIANGLVTLFPNSEPSVDVALQTSDNEVGYKIIAKGSLDALALDFEVPSGIDLLNNGQLVTAQDLMFQGILNLPAKQLNLSASLGNTVTIDSQASTSELALATQWSENQDGSIASINLQAEQGGLIATTTVDDVANLEDLVINLSGQGNVDKLAALFSYDVSGILNTQEEAIQITASPLSILGDANFIGQVQGQDINVDLQAQGATIVGDVKTSLLGQEQRLTGEIFPSLALNTTVPYLGEVLLSGSPDALQVTGQGVVDIKQHLSEFSTTSQLTELYIEPQAWQLSGDISSQRFNLQVGQSVAQFELLNDENQNVSWSLVANIDQQATWQNIPVQLTGGLQHSSEQAMETFQGSLIANGLPIAIEGNQEQVTFSATPQLRDVLSLGLVDIDIANLLNPIAEEPTNVEGTIDLASGVYDIRGQISNEYPLGFSANNHLDIISLSVDGATEVLGRIDWQQQWPVVGEWVGSSLATASTISLETEFQSSVNDISELTVSLDKGATIAIIPLNNQSQLQIDSTVGWLKKLAGQPQSQSNQIQLQSILETASLLFADEEFVRLQFDPTGQNLNASVGTADNPVVLTLENLLNPALSFDAEIPSERILAWQAEGLFDNQTIVPESVLNYITSNGDFGLSGQYNRETQAFNIISSVGQLGSSPSTITISNPNSETIAFEVDAPVTLLAQPVVQSILPMSLQNIVTQASLSDDFRVTGLYNLVANSYDLDVLLKHSIGENTVVKLKSQANNQVAIQVDMPATIASKLLTQSVQLPSNLTTVATQLVTQARLSAQGNYNFESQSYDLDFKLNQANQEVIPFGVSTSGDGLLNVDVELSPSEMIELIRQSGSLSNLPVSVQQIIVQLLNQNSDLIKVSGNYNQLAQTYAFTADVLQGEEVASQLVLEGNAVDGIDVLLDTDAGLLGRLELSQFPLNTTITSLLTNYLQSPNTQAIQLSTKIDSSPSNTIDIQVSHPNLTSSKLSIGLVNGSLGTASMTAPTLIARDLVSDLVRNLNINVENQYLDVILQKTLNAANENISVNYSPLELNGYQLDIVSSTIEAVVRGSNNTQSPLQLQLKLPAEITRQVAMEIPSLQAFTSSFQTLPLPEIVIASGNYYPYNQSYQLSSNIPHGSGLVTELEMDNLQGDNQVKLSTPFAFVPSNAYAQLGLPVSFSTIIAEWQQASHNVSSKLELEVSARDTGFGLAANLSHNGYLASTLSLNRTSKGTDFELDTPSQPLMTLSMFELPANIESTIDGLLNKSDRLKFNGNLQSLSDDFEIDVLLSRVNLANDFTSDISAKVVKKVGQYNLQSRLEQKLVQNYIPSQFTNYSSAVPDFTDVILNWQTPEEINIRIQGFDPVGNSLMTVDSVLSNSTNLQFTTSLEAQTLSPLKSIFQTSPLVDYVSLDQLSLVELTGNLNLQNNQYLVDALLNKISTIQIQGDSTRADFSGQLNTQLLSLNNLAQEVQTEFVDISYLPFQGNYEFVNGGSYSVRSQLEGEAGITASITDGRANIQMEGLSLERIPVVGGQASWVASFENFNPSRLQILDIYQNSIARLGNNAALLNQARLSGVLRSDGTLWQGEVLVSTGRTDVSDIRVIGQDASLYIQTSVSFAGQELDVSGPVYPNFVLQVQGDYVDASGVARAHLEGQITDWQQPTFNGLINTTAWQRGDVNVGIQEATIQASITDFQNWQESLYVRIAASDPVILGNVLEYQAQTITGNWTLPVNYRGDAYTVSLSPTSNRLKLTELSNIQLQDLNLQANVVSDLFNARLRNINVNQENVLVASVSLEPQKQLLATLPIQSLQNVSIPKMTGDANYNFISGRLELNTSLNVLNQVGSLNFISDLGQTSSVVSFPSFVPSAIPEIAALSIPTDFGEYLNLNDSVNFGLTLDSEGIQFQSTGTSLNLTGQVSDGVIDATAQHIDGTVRLTGVINEPLQVAVNIPNPTKVLSSYGFEQLPNVADIAAILQNQILVDGTLDLRQGASFESVSFDGIARSTDKEIQITYANQPSIDVPQVYLSTQINDRNTIITATKIDNTNNVEVSDAWQVAVNYGGLQVFGTVENEVDRVSWQLQGPSVAIDNLPLPLTVNVTGQLNKTDWLPVGNWTGVGEIEESTLKLEGDYRGTVVNWQAQGASSTGLFTKAFDRPLTFVGRGSCLALDCSLTQSQIQVEDVTANVAGALSPILDINGALQHSLLETLDVSQSATIRLTQEQDLGYLVNLSYQNLQVDARLNQQAVPQSVNVRGELTYQDKLSNQYSIEAQDLSWTSIEGYKGSANAQINQRIGTSWLNSSLLVTPTQSGLNMTGPVYLDQQAIATGNIQANFVGETNFDLSGYIDVNAPLQLLNANLPSSLGNLETRLTIVKDVNSQSVLPYQLVGNIESLAGISTTGSLLLDLQTGVTLDVETVGQQGISLVGLANDNAWQLDADLAGLELTKEVIELFPLAPTDLASITGVLNEFKEVPTVDGNLSLLKPWQEELQVQENQVEVRVGSSSFTGQLQLSDTISFTGQLDLNGTDLSSPLPITVSGPINVNPTGEISISNALELKSDYVETLNLSGSISPLSLYVQSPQSIKDASYLFVSTNQNQEIEVSGNLTTLLKSGADTPFANTSLAMSTSEQKMLNVSLLGEGFTVKTVLPAKFNDLRQITSDALSFELSGHIGSEGTNPIFADLLVSDSTLNVENLIIENEYGQANLGGNIDLGNMPDVSQSTSIKEVLGFLQGDLIGSIKPNWLAVSEQITLPEGFSNSLPTLPISASLQDSLVNIASISSFGTIALQTNLDVSNTILDIALNYEGLGINGQASYIDNQVSGEFNYSGLNLVVAGEAIGMSGTASLLQTRLASTGTLYALEQSASYRADIGWQSLAKRLENQLANSSITEQVLLRLPQATSQDDIRIDIVDFSATAITPLQRILPYFSPEVDGTVTIQNGILLGQFQSELLTRERQLPVDIRLDGLVKDSVLSEAKVSLVIDESPARAVIDFELQERILNGRASLEYFPLQTLLGIVPQESQAFENLQVLEPFTTGLETTDNLSKLDLRVTGVGSAYVPLDQLRQSQILLVAEQVIFDHESFVREAGIVKPVDLRTQGQLTLRYQQEVLDIEQAQFQSYRQSDQSLAGNWSASGQISEDRLGVNLTARAADLNPFILLSPVLAEQNVLAKGDFNISAQGSLREPVLFFSSNQFEADIGGGYVESEDVSFFLENGEIRGRVRLSVARPWQSEIEAEFQGPVQLWPLEVGNIVTDFRSPTFSTNFFGDFKTISGRIYQQDGSWLLNANGDLDNPFQIMGTLNPLGLNFRGNQLNLYSEAFFVSSSLSDIDLGLSYESPNFVLRGDVVASEAELITRNTVRARRSDNPQFFERVLFDNVLLTAPRNMIFSESFLTAELATELYLAGSLAQPTLDGEAKLLEGELRYSGQSFILSNGTVRFDKLQGIYPTVSASAYANLDKTRLSSNPESYVIQPNTSQFQIFLDANGGYTFSPTEERYQLDLDAILSSNAIVNPNSPRSLTEEDIVSLLTLKRITTDGTTTSDNVFGEVVGVNVVDAAADILEGAIGSVLGEGVDVFTTGLSNIISDTTNPDSIADPFGFGVRFSGYLDDSVYASYELGSFTNSNYSLRNQFDLRYDDIFGLNRLGVNVSSTLDFASDGGDPLVGFNMGWDYEINETISLSNNMELSNDDQELSFGIQFKW